MVFESILGGFFGALDAVFNPLINSLGPVLAIVLIAAIIALVTTVAQKFLVNQDRLLYLQKEMKEYQQEMMEARKTNDPKALDKVQKKQAEFMNLQKEMMSMSFRPMIVTFVPILIVFWWMAQSTLNHLVIQLPAIAYYVLLVPLFHLIYPPSPGVTGMTIEWLGWYILCSFGFSMLFRKLMGIKSGGM